VALCLRPDLRVVVSDDGAVRLKSGGAPLLDVSDEPLRGLVLALLQASEVEDLARGLALDVAEVREAVDMLREMDLVVDCPPPRPRAPVDARIEPPASPDGTLRLLACPSDGGRPRVGPRTACARCFHARRAAVRAEGDSDGMVPSISWERFLDAIETQGPTVGPGEWVWLDADGTNPTRHAWLPLPWCKTCEGGAAPGQGSDRPACDGPAAGLVDDGSGLLSSVTVREDGPVHHAVGHLGDVSTFAPTWCYRLSGGTALTPEEARGKAVGEGLERYCGALAVLRASEPTPWRMLGARALHPAAVPLFSARQYSVPGFPYAPFTEDTPARWVPGTTAAGAPILLPAALVALPYEPRAGEPSIAPDLSHGLACGRTLEAAVTAALCELVERHAFTTFWLRQGRARRLRWTHPLGDEIASRGWRVTVLDLRDDVPLPSFLAIARSAEHALWIGAGAAEDAEVALTRALLEVFQNHAWLSADPPGCAGAVPETFEEHGAWYVRHAERVAALRFLEPDDGVDLAAIRAAPRWRDAVGDHYVCDLTTRDVATAGFSVVRVLAPSLARLHADHRHPFLGHPRLAQVRDFPPHPFP